ncbi:hypothetical protein Q5P01_022568 [Channa striata]|uniref:Uncharacterized protein n=1 Tax=Channa striata TaxID=64152 RepID=A0AA88IXL9_CHASR|nr:hypothetical protein Q5P01_022568 [Channa striata]
MCGGSRVAAMYSKSASEGSSICGVERCGVVSPSHWYKRKFVLLSSHEALGEVAAVLRGREERGQGRIFGITRPGVRGLIICTDPALSPQGGCLGTVALDPIDTVRGRRRGEENRPWLQSVGPPRQVDECPGLHDLCHPNQWSQATMSYSLHVRNTLLLATTTTNTPLPRQPTSSTVPPEPELASLPPSTNTGGLSLTAPRRTSATTSLALSTRSTDCADSTQQHTRRSDHNLAQVTSAYHFIPLIPLLAAYGRLPQHQCMYCHLTGTEKIY